MRVVSLIASSTEMVWALGQGQQMVARSHECDYPPEVRALPVLTAPKLKVEADPLTGREPSSVEIDAQVKALVREALAVYRVDAEALDAVRPDVIITQTQCEVCAVSLRDVEAAVCKLVASHPKIVALEPNSLDDIFRDLRRVADALGVPERGLDLERELRGRIDEIAGQARRLAATHPAPSIACVEWIEPLMAAGNWMPTLVELAGGRSLFGEAGKHSPFMSFAELAARDPDVILVLPCGFDIARTRREMPALVAQPGWEKLRAVKAGRVYLGDGNQYFNRPGPRVVESLEVLVEVLWDGTPGAPRYAHEGEGWVRWPTPGQPSSVTVRAAADQVDRRHSEVPEREDKTMALDSIRVSAVITAPIAEIYSAWLDSERHGAFTGDRATVDPRVGGRHTAWDGYIEGEILELEPPRRIVQSWRSLDFPQDAAPSRLEVVLDEAPGGTEVTLIHTEIPEGQGVDYEEGWVEHYFKPMQRYFSAASETAASAEWPRESTVRSKAQSAPKAKAAPKKKVVAKAKAAPKKKVVAKAKKKVVAKAKGLAKKKAAPKKKVAAKVKAAPKKKVAAKKKAAPKKKAAAKKKSAAKK